MTVPRGMALLVLARARARVRVRVVLTQVLLTRVVPA